MTPAQRLERIFRGDMVDIVPFALKGWRLGQCEDERRLRNDGMAILDSAPVYRTTWLVEPPFRSADDYATLEFMIKDRRYEPCYDVFEKAVIAMGGEAFFKTGAPGCALHTVLYSFMGPERFAIEWSERRDRVLQLCAVMEANEKEVYQIVARSPALLVQCGGNYAPEMLGLERFAEHVLPHWDAAAAVLHVGD